ncbi:hypothetical protein NM688_g2638 [Phlebia brevispora]|uniref:Uncharacterized protein n=1 Tax=Phlebia brevispora TaxID=194682 RepID=A0ACC1T7T3_9APHY|nr:hypothetical protein NM688_g2638 [Phlebia brevispora]
MSIPTLSTYIPTHAELQERTQQVFGRRPCRWQCKVAQAILKRQNDVVNTAPTGSGKTLTFWMPLLFRPTGTVIVITPLNILGSQNREQLARLGIWAISIDAQSATPESLQHIEEGRYRVVVVNPKVALRRKGAFERLWRSPAFTSRLISIIWDEAHCVSSGIKLLKFLVFFDKKSEAIAAADHLRSRLPREFHHKIVWFNSDNTQEFYAFGMGVDMRDIEIVVQWRTTCTLDALWQRFGRAARDPSLEAIVVLFVEARYFDDAKAIAAERTVEKKRKEARKAVERETSKRKHALESQADRRAKRAKTIEKVGDASDSNDGPDQGSPTVYEILRAVYRQSVQNCANKGKKASVEDLTPEMDNLVNACWREFKCYRAPIMAFYENDRISAAREECQPDGCSRCSPTNSPICCELCWNAQSTHTHQNPFRMLPTLDALPAQEPAGTHTSNIKKDYAFEPADIQLQDALHEFRNAKTIKLFGLPHLVEMGPTLVMGDDTLQRIIDCARVHKIDTTDALKRETKWARTLEFGAEILAIIHRYYPIPEPSQPAAAGSRKCSKCSSTTHISSNSLCPKYIKPASRKENAAPKPRCRSEIRLILYRRR